MIAMGITSGEEKTLARVREICRQIPNAVETASWGHANWRIGKKIFAAFEEIRGARSLAVFVGVDDQEDLLEERRFSLPRYTDHHGWVCLRLDRETDWNEVRSLIARSRELMTEGA